MSGIDVFISYKREERARAKALAETLTARGHVVWWDVELLPGDQFAKAIEAVLDTCRCAVVLWSPASVESTFVRDEARRALARGVLAPVLIEPTRIPLGFGEIHTHDLTEWSGASNDPLLEPLFEAIARLASPSHDPTPARARVKEAETALVAEAVFWRGVQNADDPAHYRNYLDRYGRDGLFAPLAKANLTQPEPAFEAAIGDGADIPDAPQAPPQRPAVKPASAPPRPPRFSETWEVVHAFRAVPGEVQTVEWSPDSRRLAAEGTNSPDVTVWDAVAGNAVSAYPGPNEEARPNCIAFSPDGGEIIAGYTPTAHIFNAATGAERLALRGHKASVIAATFAPNGRHIATASLDDTIAIWNSATGEKLASIDSTGWGQVAQLSIEVPGTCRLRARYDTLEGRTWACDKPWAAPFDLTDHDAGPHIHTFANERDLRTADYNTVLELWNTGNDKRLAAVNTDRFQLATLETCDASRRYLMIIDAKVRAWSAEDGREIVELAPETGAWVRDTKFSPDGALIATGDSDGLVRVWRRT